MQEKPNNKLPVRIKTVAVIMAAVFVLLAVRAMQITFTCPVIHIEIRDDLTPRFFDLFYTAKAGLWNESEVILIESYTIYSKCPYRIFALNDVKKDYNGVPGADRSRFKYRHLTEPYRTGICSAAEAELIRSFAVPEDDTGFLFSTIRLPLTALRVSYERPGYIINRGKGRPFTWDSTNPDNDTCCMDPFEIRAARITMYLPRYSFLYTDCPSMFITYPNRDIVEIMIGKQYQDEIKIFYLSRLRYEFVQNILQTLLTCAVSVTCSGWLLPGAVILLSIVFTAEILINYLTKRKNSK